MNERRRGLVRNNIVRIVSERTHKQGTVERMVFAFVVFIAYDGGEQYGSIVSELGAAARQIKAEASDSGTSAFPYSTMLFSSKNARNCSFVCPPLIRATSFPFLNRTIVGVPSIPYVCHAL